MATGEGGEEFRIRRSTRRKRDRAEWKETLVMQVRSTRSRGDSEIVPVRTRGGKPAHQRPPKKASVEGAPAKVCHECGSHHVDEAKFCVECDTKRMQSHQPSQPSQQPAEPAPPQPPQQPHINLVSPAKPQQARNNGRPYLKSYLRCGWQDLGEKWIAPDGTEFTDREKAAKYHNKTVQKLEPQRKDGWQVYTNASRSHTDWIAPDGTKLFSYSSALAYSKNSAQALYGKDGISVGIQLFFGKGKGKTSQAKTTTPQPTTPQSKESSKETSKARVFSVPKQTEAGANLQQLCSILAVSRSRRTDLEEQIKNYICPESIKSDMATKVVFIEYYTKHKIFMMLSFVACRSLELS